MKEKLNQMFKERELVMLQKVTDKRQKGYRKDAILREIMKDEIIIEFDTDDKKLVDKLITETMKKLHQDKYKFYIYSHTGKSPHIHIYNIKQLNNLCDDIVSKYKHLFIKKYGNHITADLSLSRKGQIIAMEYKPHFKYNTIKEFLFTNDIDVISENNIDIDLILDAIEETTRYETRNTKYIDKKGDFSWLLNWFLNTKLKVGGIDNYVLKNVAIAMVNMDIDTDMFLENVIEVKGRKMYNQLIGWVRWAHQQKRYFRMSELNWYGNRHDIDFREVMRKWIIWKL